MRIVIIEDEKLTAEDLAETILKIEANVHIVAILASVKEAISYFEKNEKPDLIFSDIQLGDGLSFEIFKVVHVLTPVIFCTAYDEYALNAFKANGIDYILKPFTEKTIADALYKFKEFRNNFSPETNYEALFKLFGSGNNRQDSSILVYIKDKIIPVKLDNIALFYIENEITQLITFDQERFTVNKTLEELETFTGMNFFKANRQYLISRKAIKDTSQYFHRKLMINLSIPFTAEAPITVSKIKVTPFLNWLSGN